MQQIKGEHLIGPDGAINLGSYGTVDVAGMTVAEVRKAVEGHLAYYLDKPEVSVDVYAYNSKFYYVVTERDGADFITRIPCTGRARARCACASRRGEVVHQKLGVDRAPPRTTTTVRPRFCRLIGGQFFAANRTPRTTGSSRGIAFLSRRNEPQCRAGFDNLDSASYDFCSGSVRHRHLCPAPAENHPREPGLDASPFYFSASTG